MGASVLPAVTRGAERTMPIHEVSLADVYELDFGRRTEDLTTWAALADAAPPGAVLDVACGDGRATAGLVSRRRVYGVDADSRFAGRARAAGLDASVGRAEVPGALRVGERPALVVCAYSSLFLLPHPNQQAAIDAMAEVVAVGGIVAVETFVPKFTRDDGPVVFDHHVADPNDPRGVPWTRRSTYRVDRSARRTEIERLYGPDPGRWTMSLREVVYWRDPDEIALMFRRAGLLDSNTSTSLASVFAEGRSMVAPVAIGMALTVGRR